MTRARPIGADARGRRLAASSAGRPPNLGLEEELGELGRIGVALRQQDHDLGAGRRRPAVGRLPDTADEHAVRVAGEIPPRPTATTKRRRSTSILEYSAMATLRSERARSDAVPLLHVRSGGRREPAPSVRRLPDAVRGDFQARPSSRRFRVPR